jgi:hypothetical protein
MYCCNVTWGKYGKKLLVEEIVCYRKLQVKEVLDLHTEIIKLTALPHYLKRGRQTPANDNRDNKIIAKTKQ